MRYLRRSNVFAQRLVYVGSWLIFIWHVLWVANGAGLNDSCSDGLPAFDKGLIYHAGRGE